MTSTVRRVSAETRAKITEWEGEVLYAYDDANGRKIGPGGAVAGTLTIGVGHTGPDVRPGQTITKAQADAILANDLAKRGYAPRVCTLGHTQRGGAPTAHDRMLASILGASAVHFLLGGKSAAMVGVQDEKVALVPFKNVIGQHKELPRQLLDVATVLAS